MPHYLLIPLLIAAGLVFVALVASAVCFFKIFYAWRQEDSEEFPTPPGAVYDPFRPQMVDWIKRLRALEHTDVKIRAFDGLTLCGTYYECKKGAPIEILFHGYQGTAERDLNGGVFRCFAAGRNALIVDHRAHGKSEGRVITFGARERRDCLSWVDFVVREIDKDAKIILTGVSMGAATVMLAASMPLPPNVVGILADCGYTSTKEIVKKVIRDMKLPAWLLYPFVRLGAIIYGGFDPNSYSPTESMKKCTLPIIFYHGDDDGFVPCYMSEQNFAVCTSQQKKLVITAGAGHGLCYPRDEQGYLEALGAFFEPQLKEN